MKFIYWFAYYNTFSPSVRYRGKYPLEYFRSEFGINSCFVTPGYSPTKIYHFLKAYFSALLFPEKESLIIIQRVNSNFIYASLLKLLVRVRRKQTVYDLDDADYLEYSPETIHFFIKNCTAVMVGSHELAKNISRLNRNILLNTSSLTQIGIMKKRKNNLLTIGWIGGFGGSHKISLLKYFFPSLSGLPFKVKLVLLGVADKENYNFLTNYFKRFPNVILDMPQNINWYDETEIQHRIAEFDIGIATLLNTEAQRSKSAFKLKQYMNNGVPVLSSDISENNLFINHGFNGYLCNTPHEFRERIIEIENMNGSEYEQLSRGASSTIPLFSVERYCRNIMDFYASPQVPQKRISLSDSNIYSGEVG